MAQRPVEGISITIDTKPLDELYRRVPKIVFAELHDTMAHMFAKSRRAVIDSHPGTKKRGMKGLATRGTKFVVWPRKGHGGDRRERLSDIVGVMFETGDVVRAHELGATIAPGRHMVIPIGFGRTKGTNRVKAKFATKGPRGALKPSIREAKRVLKSEGKDLIPKRTAGGDVIYYQRSPVKRRAKSGKKQKRRKAGNARNRARYTLKPVFLLKRQVTIKPTLGMLSKWKGLASWRTQLLSKLPAKIVAKAIAQQQRRAG